MSVIPFEPCSSIVITGATGSGKSSWVSRFLHHLKEMYVKDPPKKVLYCYGVYQELFAKIEHSIPNISFRQGLPSEEDVDELSSSGEHTLIVLDDLMHQVVQSQDMELLFTQGCHHRHISVILITQALFYQGKKARTIALNTWYTVLMKNVRDVFMVATLGRQLGKGQLVTKAYQDCLKKPYGYLVIDTSPHSEDDTRLRTHIFPGETPVVYL